MTTILDRIVDVKRLELERHMAQTPLPALEERIRDLPLPLNLSGALMGEGPRLIAECKKASPSRGLLRDPYDPVALATAYAENGAAAVSVLTERDHFQGGLEHMESVKAALGPWALPVLRKDFLFDPYQVYEARAYGADAVLLIAAILTDGAAERASGCLPQPVAAGADGGAHGGGDGRGACGRRGDHRHQQPGPPHVQHRHLVDGTAGVKGAARADTGQRERHPQPG